MAAFEEGNHLCFDILYKTSAGHGGQNDVLDFDYQAFGNGLAVGSADTGTLDPSHFVAAGAGHQARPISSKHYGGGALNSSPRRPSPRGGGPNRTSPNAPVTYSSIRFAESRETCCPLPSGATK